MSRKSLIQKKMENEKEELNLTLKQLRMEAEIHGLETDPMEKERNRWEEATIGHVPKSLMPNRPESAELGDLRMNGRDS